MRVHFIVDGIVINTVEQDTLENPFGYLAVADEQAGIGWLYSDGVFSPPTQTNVQREAELKQTVRNSYRTRLRGKAAALGGSGDFFAASKLLIKASEV